MKRDPFLFRKAPEGSQYGDRQVQQTGVAPTDDGFTILERRAVDQFEDFHMPAFLRLL